MKPAGLLLPLLLPTLALSQAVKPSPAAASSSRPGVVTTEAQTFAGSKTFAAKAFFSAGLGGTFSANHGINLAYGANGIGLRTGSLGGGDVAVLDSGGNVFARTSSDGIHIHGARTLWLTYTNAAATPGGVTIDKPSGRAAIASGAGAATVTDSLVAATSVVVCSLETVGTGAAAVLCAPSAGSFVATAVDGAGAAVNVSANATFSFLVVKTE